MSYENFIGKDCSIPLDTLIQYKNGLLPKDKRDSLEILIKNSYGFYQTVLDSLDELSEEFDYNDEIMLDFIDTESTSMVKKLYVKTSDEQVSESISELNETLKKLFIPKQPVTNGFLYNNESE